MRKNTRKECKNEFLEIANSTDNLDSLINSAQEKNTANLCAFSQQMSKLREFIIDICSKREAVSIKLDFRDYPRKIILKVRVELDFWSYREAIEFRLCHASKGIVSRIQKQMSDGEYWPNTELHFGFYRGERGCSRILEIYRPDSFWAGNVYCR